MRDPSVVTSRAQFEATVADAPAGARVPLEVQMSVTDPFAAYRRARSGPGGAYLETTGGQSGWGYFAVDPIDRLTVWPEATHWTAESQATDSQTDPRNVSTPSLAALEAWLADRTLVRGDCSVPYPCGAIGWLSYDIARELESLPDATSNQRSLPRIQVALFDRMAAWSEPRETPTTLRITACPVVTPTTTPETLYAHAKERAFDLVERIQTGTISDQTTMTTETAPTVTFESECGQAAFADRVRTIKQHITDGDTFQTNVSHRLSGTAVVAPTVVFDALREVNPAPYSALLEYPTADLVSASPELLLDQDGRHLVTEPIAGTRPRGDTDAADQALEAELRNDDKERAEHAMLVDLERNDLGAVAEYGSVEVSEYRRVDRYSEVMHLVSQIEAQLQEGATLRDAIAAVFPGGTITGAPKPKTMELIERVERTRRGPYTGSIGIFGLDHQATLNITIRTLVRHADRYYLRVGAGIVHDSVPKQEYAETLDKARALINAVNEALGTQTTLTLEEDHSHA